MSSRRNMKMLGGALGDPTIANFFTNTVSQFVNPIRTSISDNLEKPLENAINGALGQHQQVQNLPPQPQLVQTPEPQPVQVSVQNLPQHPQLVQTPEPQPVQNLPQQPQLVQTPEPQPVQTSVLQQPSVRESIKNISNIASEATDKIKIILDPHINEGKEKAKEALEKAQNFATDASLLFGKAFGKAQAFIKTKTNEKYRRKYMKYKIKYLSLKNSINNQ
jgi:hypothetical protein